MKKLILAVLVPAAFVFAGCEDPCKTGVELKNRMQTLELAVGGTITTPSSLDSSCASFRGAWVPELQKGSAFASRAARDYFYSEETRCRAGHNELRCWWETDADAYPPYRPHRYRTCQTYFVCDSVEVIPHKKDGYENAMALSAELARTDLDLNAACAAHDRGADLEALARLGAAKLNLHSGQENAELVLVKAGCYNRKGD